jgi:hypothetical protein
MKLKEIEIGEEYATGSPNAKHDRRWRKRFKAKEIGKFFKQKPRFSHKTPDRRRVKGVYLNKDGTEGKEKVLDAREVLQPWEEYTEEIQAEKERSARIRREREEKTEESERQKERLTQKLVELGAEKYDYRDEARLSNINLSINQYGTGSVKMSFNTLEKILEAAENKS